MFYLSLLEGNGPVRIVSSHWGLDEKGSRELGVNDHFGAGIEILDERTLVLGIGEDVVIYMSVGFDGLTKIFLGFFLSENIDRMRILKWTPIVGPEKPEFKLYSGV